MAINFFKLEKRFLSFLWFWPSPELMTRKELLKIIVNSVLMMTSITGGVFYALAKSKEDLPTSLNALGPVASKFSVLLKVLVLYWNRFHVMDCLGIFKRKMDKELAGKHTKTFIKPIKIANLASVLLAINISVTCIYYIMLPVIQAMIGTYQGTPYEKTTPFRMLFPFRFNDILSYEFKYALSIYNCFTSLLGYVGVDGLFVGFCLHLSCHFKVIAMEVMDLDKFIADPDGTAKCSAAENGQIEKAITAIVERHVEILLLTKKISEIFKFIVFIHFFAAAIVIGMTSINFLLANWSAKMLYTNYMMGSLLHAYLYSATGEYLHNSTFEIMNSAYHIKWYKCNTRNQKALQLMIRRSQYYTGLDVPFFETNLSTFTSIVKTAGSYITLMNALL